uniref:uroplakin-3a n=1 Tax=Euleptes europaea TaxID=460621 RepID=UPI00253FEEC8|nr:uroplakin-3a [Euleptes europaea]
MRPQIANLKFVTNNPTLTTIALEKPFCAFDDSVSKGASYEISLYVMVDSDATSSTSVTDDGDKPLRATFHHTKGGQLGPYKAGTFNIPNCISPPKLSDAADSAKASTVLSEYLIRVGDDSACPYDTELLEVCNSPLSEDTSYRFKFVLIDRTAGIVKDQTLWSDPIKTNKLRQSSTIETWPGQRSNGMIAITYLLSMLTLIVVAAFFATLKESRKSSTEVRYQCPTTQGEDDPPVGDEGPPVGDEGPPALDEDPTVEESSTPDH